MFMGEFQKIDSSSLPYNCYVLNFIFWLHDAAQGMKFTQKNPANSHHWIEIDQKWVWKSTIPQNNIEYSEYWNQAIEKNYFPSEKGEQYYSYSSIITTWAPPLSNVNPPPVSLTPYSKSYCILYLPSHEHNHLKTFTVAKTAISRFCESTILYV